ncbi:hypothetical protein [Pseudomonas sp. BN102]|uniref:hypothetical protein n=1 Tax=Pseudomonas sp. BN102 TaxID=2567886 RepID=UPI0024549AA5|nr:hypothetical protein [Pseudomonas sp. BN102]
MGIARTPVAADFVMVSVMVVVMVFAHAFVPGKTAMVRVSVAVSLASMTVTGMACLTMVAIVTATVAIVTTAVTAVTIAIVTAAVTAVTAVTIATATAAVTAVTIATVTATVSTVTTVASSTTAAIPGKRVRTNRNVIRHQHCRCREDSTNSQSQQAFFNRHNVPPSKFSWLTPPPD